MHSLHFLKDEKEEEKEKKKGGGRKQETNIFSLNKKEKKKRKCIIIKRVKLYSFNYIFMYLLIVVKGRQLKLILKD